MHRLRRLRRLSRLICAFVGSAAPLLPALVTAAATATATVATTAATATPADEPPPTLAATGWRADGQQTFSPQYALWSDGATKKRWVRLPPGKTIAARQPDAWVFPPGTRLWKEFAHEGRPVETRYIERRRDGSWLFASYVWNEAGTAATLAPAAGLKLALRGAPGGRYTVPARADCLACHGSAAVPVLGFSAMQLADDRDPLALHTTAPGAGDVTLRKLVARGWLRGLPQALLDTPPRIAAVTPVERAALGYLHANCAHCHNGSAQRVPVRLNLAQQAGDAAGSRQLVLRSLLNAPSRFQLAAPATSASAGGVLPVVAPGDGAGSVLALRLQSRHAAVQMPPLGTEVVDAAGLALVLQWINQELPSLHTANHKGNEP